MKEYYISRVSKRRRPMGIFTYSFGGSDLSFTTGLIIGETFGEVLGPRRPTVSELRPAQKLGVK